MWRPSVQTYSLYTYALSRIPRSPDPAPHASQGQAFLSWLGFHQLGGEKARLGCRAEPEELLCELVLRKIIKI